MNQQSNQPINQDLAQHLYEREKAEAERAEADRRRDNELAAALQATEAREHERWEEEREITDKQGWFEAEKAAMREWEEEKAQEKRERKQLSKDAKIAQKMQVKELRTFRKQKERFEKIWGEPKVNVEQVDSRVELTMILPGVDQMNVELEPEEKRLIIEAWPLTADLSGEALKIAEEIDADPIRVTIDMRSYEGDAADGFIDPSKITSDYNPKTALLTITMMDMVQAGGDQGADGDGDGDGKKGGSKRGLRRRGSSSRVAEAVRSRFVRAFRRSSSSSSSNESRK